MTQESDLFSAEITTPPNPLRANPVPSPTVDVGQVIQDAWEIANKEPLSETLNALKRIPESLRPAVELVVNRIYQNTFIQSYEQVFQTDPKMRSQLNTASMLNHAAKLLAFSAVGHFASNPWHIADSALLTKMSNSLKGSESLTPAAELIESAKSTNVFVAAMETDDRDSYLKAVKRMVSRQKINQIVLDAELIEWRPEADFMAACSTIGISPSMVGISDRKTVAKHGTMLSTAERGIPSVFVDTQGRPLNPGKAGEMFVAEFLPSKPKPESTQTASVIAMTEAPISTAPSSDMHNRLKELKARQARRMSP